MKKIVCLVFCLPFLFTACQAADTVDAQRNEALKKGLVNNAALANVSLEITNVSVNWDGDASEASGRFSVKAKTTEGLYKVIDHAAGLKKLEITDIHESELNAAVEKIDNLPMSYRTNLRNALAADRMDLPRFYDVFVPKGGEVTVRGSVKLVKYGDEDWQIEEIQVNPLLIGNVPLGNDFTPASRLQAGEHRLDDPKTKEAVNAVIQCRKDFVAKVESAGKEWQEEQKELNAILKKALDGRKDFENLPIEVTEITGNWTEKSSSDASGTFTVKGKATEGLYKAMRTLEGLQKLGVISPEVPGGSMMPPGAPMIEPMFPKVDELYQGGKITYDELQSRGGITDLFEREFDEARDKMNGLPETHAGTLRNTMPQDRLDWQFYDLLIPQGAEITASGHVRLVKYGDDDWEVDEIMVNPVDIVANNLIPESQLREGYKLDDPKTNEVINVAIQKRKDFVTRVDAAVNEWTLQQQRQAAEEERKRLEEERIVKEKRKVERETLKKSAVSMDAEFHLLRGYHNQYNRGEFSREYVAGTLVYGTAALQMELKESANRLRNAGPFEDKAPLQQAVEAVRAKIETERKQIAEQTFHWFCRAQGSNLTVDLQKDEAGFTMNIDTNFTITGMEQEVIEEILFFPRLGLTVNGARSTNDHSRIVLNVKGNVATIQDMWENWQSHRVIVYFNNMRAVIDVPTSDAGYSWTRRVPANVIGIEIIDTRVRQPDATPATL